MSAPPLPARSRSLVTGLRTVGAMALAMLLASCSFLGQSNDGSSQGTSTGQADPSIAAAAPEGLKDFYSQDVVWEPCEDKLQCAKIKVPLDYAKPDGDTIEIAALKISSTGARSRAACWSTPAARAPPAMTSSRMPARATSPRRCGPTTTSSASIPAASSVPLPSRA